MSVIELHVTPDVVQAYAEVAGDFNPIHFDDEAARAIGLPARIAHGMISGALLSKLLTREFGERWLRGGALTIKFVRPVFVGDVVSARAVEREPGIWDVEVRNGEDAPVVVGAARLRGSDASL